MGENPKMRKLPKRKKGGAMDKKRTELLTLTQKQLKAKCFEKGLSYKGRRLKLVKRLLIDWIDSTPPKEKTSQEKNDPPKPSEETEVSTQPLEEESTQPEDNTQTEEPKAKPEPTLKRKTATSNEENPGKKIKNKKKKVSFQEVEVRQYNRRHGGGGGVPSAGAYPLGLDWSFENVEKYPLAKFEEMRAETRQDIKVLQPLTVNQRKKLLKKADKRSKLVRAGSYLEQESAIKALKQSRQGIGCECENGAQCKTETCHCFKNELQCDSSACNCETELCSNPQKLVWDQDRVDDYRKKSIEQFFEAQ